MVKRASTALIAVAVLVAAGALFALSPKSPFYGGWPVQQPIAFNHNIHVEELGFECTDCHLYALTSVRATIPNLDN